MNIYTYYKLKHNKRSYHVVNERYHYDNDIYVINGSLSYCSISNSDIIIPSIECLANCIQFIPTSLSSSASLLLTLSSSLHHVLDNHSISYSYQKTLKSCIWESPIITTIIFFNEYLRKIHNEKRIKESAIDYNNRIFINACEYLKTNNNVKVIAIDTYDNLYSLCKKNNISVITLNDLIQIKPERVSSSLLSSNLKIEVDEFLFNFRKGTALINDSRLYDFQPYLSNADIRKGLSSGSLLKGIIRMGKYPSHQAEIELHSQQYYNRVIIDGYSELNRAMDGDEVVIKVNSKTAADFNCEIATGSVLGILKRSMKDIVATVPNNNTTNSDNILVIPVDKRIPKVRVRIRNWNRLQSHKILISIDGWDVNSNYPNGHYVRLIGQCGDLKTEIDSLLLKNSIFPRPFSRNAIACLPKIPLDNNRNEDNKKEWIDSGWIMPESEIFNGTRLDMRTNRRVFSVDPEGCQDIDDAMSVEWIRPGVIEVAISIADVCAFVPQLSALDIEAQNRGTTVYLVDQRIDMLPSLLSSDIASLHGNKDRYAFTMKMTANVYHSDRTIVSEDKDPMKLDDCNDIYFDLNEDVWVGRTAIRSAAAMTYEQAHNLICNKNPNIYPKVPMGQAGGSIPGSLHHALRKDLRLLTVFSRYLKKRRQVNGSFDLHSSVELKYQTDLEGSPVAIKQKNELEIHDTIAELMIITNSKVAEIICQSTKSVSGGLVRIHMPPSSEDFDKLQSLFEVAALECPRTLREVNLVINKIIADNNSYGNPNIKSVIDYLTSILIKSMSEARYCCSAALVSDLFSKGGDGTVSNDSKTMGHYGLGLKYYTHFTSPIRRYADVVVHRQLLAVISSLSSSSSVSISSGYQYKAIAPESSVISVLDILRPDIDNKFNSNDLLDELLEDNAAVNTNAAHDDLLDTLLGTNSSNTSNNIDDLLDHLLESNNINTLSNIDSLMDNLLNYNSKSNMEFTTANNNDTTTISASNNIEPYGSMELERISKHLNTMNRRAKQVQRDVSKLYLSIYFSKHKEEHDAIIYDIKDNALLVYLPVFDYKGTVFDYKGTDSSAILKTMQRITVEVSCESIDSLNLTLTLISINSNSGDSTFKTTFSAITKSISSTDNKENFISTTHKVVSNMTNTNNTIPSNSIFQVIRKFRDNRTGDIAIHTKSNINVKKEKLVAKTSTKRMDVSGRIAFGDATTSSLFFQTKVINSSNNNHTNDKALSVASSALTKGRDAAYEKMKALGEEWAEEEELEDLACFDQKPSQSSNDNPHRQFQRDTALAMNRVNKLKTEKRKSSMYR